MPKIRIKQVRSTIGSTQRQKKTIQALGLGKINRVVEKETNPQITGMVNKVHHLVEVEEL